MKFLGSGHYFALGIFFAEWRNFHPFCWFSHSFSDQPQASIQVSGIYHRLLPQLRGRSFRPGGYALVGDTGGGGPVESDKS